MVRLKKDRCDYGRKKLRRGVCVIRVSVKTKITNETNLQLKLLLLRRVSNFGSSLLWMGFSTKEYGLSLND